MSTTSPQGTLACNTVLPILGIIVVSFRFYARLAQNAKLKIDDWLQIPALLFFIGMAIPALYAVKHHAFGYATPVSSLTDPPASLKLAEKLLFIIQIQQIFALAIIKIAALLFYRRLFVVSQANRVLNIIIWTLVGITIAWAISFIAWYISACGSHVQAAWSGYAGFIEFCLISEHYEDAYAISDFILDTFVLLLPLPSIWVLQMKISRKIALSSVFLLALIGYGASIARVVMFETLSNGALRALSNGLPDVQTTDTQCAWFSSLEIGFSIIALNLPSIWPLISKISIERIINSIRSVISLDSNNSRTRVYKAKSGEKSTHLDTAHSDNVDLVPTINGAGFDIIAEGDWRSRGKSSSSADLDIEQGIQVQKSVDIAVRAT